MNTATNQVDVFHFLTLVTTQSAALSPAILHAMFVKLSKKRGTKRPNPRSITLCVGYYVSEREKIC